MADMILNLPFDEAPGSGTAYDYSPSRADGQVEGAEFVTGRNGNAIEFNETGYVLVNGLQTGVSLTGNFTLMAYVNAGEIEVGMPSKLYFIFNYADEHVEELNLDIIPGSWISLAIVKDGNTFTIYLNAQEAATFTYAGTFLGMGVNQALCVEYGLGRLDDAKLFNGALTQAEIIEELSDSKALAYYMDGENFKDYGVFVSGSDGIISRPKMKSPKSVDWDNYHGEVVDLSKKFVEPRNITLNCFIKAGSKNEFLQKMVAFLQKFDKAGTNRLMIDVHPIRPLVYEVYAKDEIAVSKVWDDNLMVGTFKLKLVEPEPVKRVLKHYVTGASNKTLTITVKTSKFLNVYWGDGSVDYDVVSDGQTRTNQTYNSLNRTVTVTHTYTANGEYFPIITGCIDEIDNATFSTDAIVVWSKL